MSLANKRKKLITGDFGSGGKMPISKVLGTVLDVSKIPLKRRCGLGKERFSSKGTEIQIMQAVGRERMEHEIAQLIAQQALNSTPKANVHGLYNEGFSGIPQDELHQHVPVLVRAMLASFLCAVEDLALDGWDATLPAFEGLATKDWKTSPWFRRLSGANRWAQGLLLGRNGGFRSVDDSVQLHAAGDCEGCMDDAKFSLNLVRSGQTVLYIEPHHEIIDELVGEKTFGKLALRVICELTERKNWKVFPGFSFVPGYIPAGSRSINWPWGQFAGSAFKQLKKQVVPV